MKITLRTLKRESFPLEVQPKDTVLALKQKIGAQFNHLVSWIKLIYAGKILSDESTLESYSIKENDFIVLMVSKPKEVVEEKTKLPVKTEVQTPTGTQPTDTSSAELNSKNTPSSTESTPPENLINKITEMGFLRDSAINALKSTSNNLDDAIEYLMTGSLGHGVSGSGTGTNTFDFLRNFPQFNTLKSMIQSNPQLLHMVIQLLAASNPQIIDLISQHQDEFVQLLNEPIEISEQEAMATLPPEEEAAIARLSNLGFDRLRVMQAYVFCDKDEQLAANFLLEGELDDGEDYDDDVDDDEEDYD
eukprot:TRINITY_DN1518_c0_g1_i2.p1 TRINITY_DN1518_c0_g1~~TRINITY_DN1518_c0_g1_i2.p1  ORF type:complete len:304 (+),score=62.59 TRINITY_DN1518_c0_g1_i2:90-1001(+)